MSEKLHTSYRWLMGLGLEFCIYVVLCGSAGYGVDMKMGSFPWGLLIGIGVGIGGGIYVCYRRLRRSKW